MLFGQDGNVGVWAAAAGIIAALLTGLGTLLGLFLKSRRESRADSVRDYQAMYQASEAAREKDKVAYEKDKVAYEAARKEDKAAYESARKDDKLEWRKEVHDLRDEHNREKLKIQLERTQHDQETVKQHEEDNRRCNDKIDKLNEQILQHEREKGEMRADIRGLQSQLRYVASATGTAPTLPSPGVIVADVAGVVRVFSPSLTGFLGWMPGDVQGQPITKLVAPAERSAHEDGMSAVTRGTKEIDPAKPINVHVLHKDGSLVPVTIYLDGRMLKTLGLIVATLQERPAITPKRPDDATPCPPETKP